MRVLRQTRSVTLKKNCEKRRDRAPDSSAHTANTPSDARASSQGRGEKRGGTRSQPEPSGESSKRQRSDAAPPPDELADDEAPAEPAPKRSRASRAAKPKPPTETNLCIEIGKLLNAADTSVVTFGEVLDKLSAHFSFDARADAKPAIKDMLVKQLKARAK